MQGMIEIVTPACSIPQSVPPRLDTERDAASTGGRVKLSLRFIITSAPRNSFQLVMKAKSATVIIDGTTAGRKTLHRSCQELAPSIMPASSSSRGTASNPLRMT